MSLKYLMRLFRVFRVGDQEIAYDARQRGKGAAQGRSRTIFLFSLTLNTMNTENNAHGSRTKPVQGWMHLP